MKFKVKGNPTPTINATAAVELRGQNCEILWKFETHQSIEEGDTITVFFDNCELTERGILIPFYMVVS